MFPVYFETLGCRLNQIETESLAQAFLSAGFTIRTGTSAEPDISEKPVSLSGGILISPSASPELCIVNTCTVTGKAEQKARRLIRLLLRNYPESVILVTGCYAELDALSIAAIDPRICVYPGSKKGYLAKLPSFLLASMESCPGQSVQDILKNFCSGTFPETDAAGIPGEQSFVLSTSNFLFHSRASVKIQDGCNNNCSYCRVRLARGRAVSLEADEVISRIRSIEEAGWNEVVLTGVNLSQYRSRDGDFARLLERILRETDHIAVRISSLYPDHIDDSLVSVAADSRIRPSFHLSVQSGSSRILEAMRRTYTPETVYIAAEKLRSVKENPFLSCDIIAGFPGETEEDFKKTRSLCEGISFAGIHAFSFSPRAGTSAYTMKPRIPERIARERVSELITLAEGNYEEYIRYWTGRALPAILERNTAGEAPSVLTANYLQLFLDSGEELPAGTVPGSEIYVKLIGLHKAKLENFV
ncbi:tRNA (N(6)-L-threonylcarbamoyladenosine(37)-C(2))-methylthiotransferase MtaB [Brucepastera parasyntrophica]|uniref:tRNA (N(6)-L-threonylcarbamoyladenosine(37)-C(2))- methylthiotransferase MtaB n=1 Tax=Brucepastera parasyntrophica TaxID=2880008 RepID=UPI00210CB98C|nr:tRNA (N(6)-L-threonylcarbamoyladenosine(37)-C(2))-methylthiotransferase MtaB [Brucepastera parasyntrophica]ULQ59470.1 tRNA (N(6)-L-threonylcarbamoyladenosine(37)-C(2))-methylthiotransferase MtaB [Brucepastera parasyntrophica]